MIKLLLSFLLLTQWAKAQDSLDAYIRCPYDSTKTDWSFMDRLYIISRVIHPASMIIPRPDTLVFNFPLPISENDGNRIREKRSVDFRALFEGAFHKDSISYKIIGVEMCALPWDCYKAYYTSNKLVYEKLTFEEKLSAMTMAFYYPTEAIFNLNYDNTRTIVLTHSVDTTKFECSPIGVRTFSKYVDFVIGDIRYKSSVAVQRKYKKIHHIFYCGDQLLGQSSYDLDGSDFPKIYNYSFWESYEKNYGM